jgi:rubrerythrin
MEVNFDEKILISQKVDPSFDEPILDQTLRIACYDEYHAYETYKKVIEKFGPVNPFANIIEAEQNHINAALVFLQKYNVEPPINDWVDKIEIPDSLIECCEVGVAAEIENIKMYDNLLSYTKQADIQDMFFRLQAASYNSHLPMFRSSVTNHYNASNNMSIVSDMASQENIMAKMNEFKDLATKIALGEADPTEISKLLGSANLSFIGGMLLGGVGASLATGMLNKDEKGEE